MRKLLILLMALIATMGVQARPRAKINIMTLPPYERAVLIIKKFETLHRPCHWPTICYGHVVQRGERFAKRQYSEREADALLRHDLNKMLTFFDGFRKSDALLLAVLSYNIGPGAVQKSSVYKKLKSGDRNIFKAYTSHCHYRGKFHKGLYSRRCQELAAIYIP